MTIQDIMNRIKAIKGDYVNGMLTSDEMVEHIEDLVPVSYTHLTLPTKA